MRKVFSRIRTVERQSSLLPSTMLKEVSKLKGNRIKVIHLGSHLRDSNSASNCCSVSITSSSLLLQVLLLSGGSVHLNFWKFSWNRSCWGCWIPWCLLNPSQEVQANRWLWTSQTHSLWHRELACLAALSRRGSSVGLNVALCRGTSGLVGGRNKAASCIAVLRSHVSHSMAKSWRAAVLKALALNTGVLHLGGWKSRRWRAVVALSGICARQRGNPGQKKTEGYTVFKTVTA